MARRPRAHLEGGIFHVTSRGNRGAPIFLDDRGRERFLDLLGETIARAQWKCIAYCLMTNHFHLAVAMKKPTLSAGMHWLNTCYAQWFNWRNGFNGHLFEERFHSETIGSEAHLLETTRYVPLNPVRAGLCTHPAAWRWSSYHATANGARGALVAVDEVLRLFGREPVGARRAYEAFVADGIGRALAGQVRGTVPGTWLDQPKPYTPA